jgi:serine/threonine protein kinase/Tol biopolymer transport system component
MNTELLARAKIIFHACIKRPTGQRAAFLELECADNPDLRELVDSLLANDEEGMGEFLQPSTPPDQPIFPTPPTAGTRLGHYQLIRSLGLGGMGQVFLAQQDEPKRHVALKILRPELINSTHSQRFKLEIEVLGLLNHPGIAQIHEAGTTDDGYSFFAMEYVPGMTLTDFSQQKKLSINQRLELVISICEALHFAHEQGIIHRDLKPANIMVLEREDKTCQPKILDFGVARVKNDNFPDQYSNTLPGQLVGTLAYMSPEQASGKTEELDSRSDIYQMGVILFELLAEKLPLKVDGLGISEALRRINDVDPVGLGKIDSTVHGDLEIITQKALAKEPDRRYGSAKELAADIRRHLQGEPIHARPITSFYRLGKVLKRKRDFTLGLMGVAAVVLLAAWFLFPHRSNTVLHTPRLIPLTAESGMTLSQHFLELSPDGLQLAISDKAGNVIIQDLDSREEEIIVQAIVGQRESCLVHWFPSGDALLVEYLIDGAEYRTVCLDLITHEETVIHQGAEPLSPILSPDGKSAAILISGKRELAILDLETAQIRSVIKAENNEILSYPTWGPHSQRLAFARAVPNLHESLVCTNLLGETSILVENLLLNWWGFNMVWLPDGRLVYSMFRDFAEQDVDLWTISMDRGSLSPTGKPQRILAMPGRIVQNLSFSPSTNRLVFTGIQRKRRPWLFEFDADGLLVRKNHDLSGWPGRPFAWMPDGKSVVIRETKGNNDTDVLVQNIHTGEFTPLLCGPENVHPLCLSADGKNLVFFNEGGSLHSLSLDGGPAHDLGYMLPTAQVIRGSSSPPKGSGSCFLFAQQGSDLVVTEIVPTGAVGPDSLRVSLGDDNGGRIMLSGVDFSPDGQQLAYVIGTEEYFIFSLKDQSTRMISCDLGRIQDVTWSADGRWIYCTGMMNPQATYWIGRIDPVSGASKLLWKSNSTWANKPVLSPDGRYIAIQMLELGTELFMAEGL